MINPCIVAENPLTVDGGRPLTLRYRVIVFDGPLPGALVRQLSAEWRRG